MIHELFLYFTEKTNLTARSFGHLQESISLIKRQKRCAKFWLSHQTHCKNLILKTITNLKQKNSILILGTGPLHEIPIFEIIKQFDRVVLVDIVHLKSVRESLKSFPNVEFIEHDISEIEEHLLTNKTIINKVPERFLNEHFDLVISANLLSQLSIHLKKFVLRKMKKILFEDIDHFCYQISKDHFQYLKKFNCPVLLITDIETHIHHKKDNVIEIETPYINFSLPDEIESWMWNLAPAPEIHPQISLQMKVVGIILNQ